MWPASWNLRLGILGLAVVPLALTLLAFIELALAAWRSTNSAGRKALREHLKTIVASAS